MLLKKLWLLQMQLAKHNISKQIRKIYQFYPKLSFWTPNLSILFLTVNSQQVIKIFYFTFFSISRFNFLLLLKGVSSGAYVMVGGDYSGMLYKLSLCSKLDLLCLNLKNVLVLDHNPARPKGKCPLKFRDSLQNEGHGLLI